MTRHLKSHEVTCPLCQGYGYGHKERLVLRWRSPEFEQTLQSIMDEGAQRAVQDLFGDDPWDVAVHIFDHDVP
jgi:hypothetical protein